MHSNTLKGETCKTACFPHSNVLSSHKHFLTFLKVYFDLESMCFLSTALKHFLTIYFKNQQADSTPLPLW